MGAIARDTRGLNSHKTIKTNWLNPIKVEPPEV
jgi:hypothetical protein